jgi:quinoprotein glucose dehydrogenase
VAAWRTRSHRGGTLAAVNLRTGTLQFEIPLGFMLDPAKHPEAEQ